MDASPAPATICTSALPTTTPSPSGMDAEPETHRQRRMPPHPRRIARHGRRIQHSSARDPCARDEIQKPAGALRNGLQAVRPRGGRNQADERQVAAARLRELIRLFRRQVHHQQPVNARMPQRIAQPRQAILQQRIVIAEQHNGGLNLRAQAPGQIKDAGQRHAARQGTHGCGLYHGAVRGGIGKRHPEFQHIHPRLAGGPQHGKTGFRIRIAGHQVAHQRLPARILLLFKK